MPCLDVSENIHCNSTIHVKLVAAVQGIDLRMSTLAVEQSKQICFLMLYFIRLKKSLVEKKCLREFIRTFLNL